MKVMKKLLTVIALVLALSLCACGGPDRQPLIDAFNKASTAFDSAAKLINENPDSIEDELITTFQQMAELLLQYKELIESGDEIPEDSMNEMIDWLGTVVEWSDSTKTVIEEALAQ